MVTLWHAAEGQTPNNIKFSVDLYRSCRSGRHDYIRIVLKLYEIVVRPIGFVSLCSRFIRQPSNALEA